MDNKQNLDQSIEDITIDNLRDYLINELDNFDKNYAIKSILAILPQSQLLEIKDSLDRDSF